MDILSDEELKEWQQMYHFLIHRKKPCVRGVGRQRKLKAPREEDEQEVVAARASPIKDVNGAEPNPTMAKKSKSSALAEDKKDKRAKTGKQTEKRKTHDEPVKSVKKRTKSDASRDTEPDTGTKKRTVGKPRNKKTMDKEMDDATKQFSGTVTPQPSITEPRPHRPRPIVKRPSLPHHALMSRMRAYAYWVAIDPEQKVGYHECQPSCTFQMFGQDTLYPFGMCMHSGAIHECGIHCENVMFVDHQSICLLTGNPIGSEFQTLNDTEPKLVANARYILYPPVFNKR